MSRTHWKLSYLIQGLSVSFRQILGLVVRHGPFTHHLRAGELQDSRIHPAPPSEFPNPSSRLRRLQIDPLNPFGSWVPKRENSEEI